VGWLLLALLGLAGTFLEPIPGFAAAARAGLFYLAAAFVPGLAVVRILGARRLGTLDSVLLPSMLAVLPFAWLGVAAMAAGVSALNAARLSAGVLAVVGALGGWPGVREGDSWERRAVLRSALAVALLLGIPLASSALAASAWDAPLHAAVATRVLGGHVPPDSPLVAGQPVHYYWLYHAHTALLGAGTGLPLYQVFGLVSLHFFLLLALAAFRVAGAVSQSRTGQTAAAALVLLGLNPAGWLIFLFGTAGDPGRWSALRVPLELVAGYPAQLSSVLHEFLDGNPFPIALVFGLVWLGVVVRWLEGERDRPAVGLGALALASALHLHLIVGFSALGAAAAGVVVAGLTGRRPARLALRGLLGMVFVAVGAALPYAWSVLAARDSLPIRLDGSPESLQGQALAIVAGCGLALLLALPALPRSRDESPGIVFLWGWVASLTTAALLVRIPGAVQYKFVYLLLFGLAPLAARAWVGWSRTRAGRTAFLAALAAGVPTSLVTSYAFTVDPPRDRLSAERQADLEWIRRQTPVDSVFVEEPDWLGAPASAEASAHRDRRWLDIPVHASRRSLVGYHGLVLREQWGHRDVPYRRRLARRLAEGRPLREDDTAHLARLAAPVYVVSHAGALAPAAFGPQYYTLAYERNEVRIYRVLLAGDSGKRARP
jgi:hypothetical protein